MPRTTNHNRRSIRLDNYDYSAEGLYFVTICTQNRHCLFGEITNGEMMLNEMGAMVDYWLNVVTNKFKVVQCCAKVIMPNHIHCVWQITYSEDETVEHTSLSEIVQWFKTMSTNEYIRNVKTKGWPPFEKRIWQRNYYEHIIRNAEEYQRIVNYINENPLHWETDSQNLKTP